MDSNSLDITKQILNKLVILTSDTSESVALSAAQILLDHIQNERVDWDSFLVSLKSPHNEVRCRLIPALSFFATPSAKLSPSANLRERLNILKVILELIKDQNKKVVEITLSTVKNIRWNSYEELELLSSGLYSHYKKIKNSTVYLLKFNYDNLSDYEKEKFNSLMLSLLNNKSGNLAIAVADMMISIAKWEHKQDFLFKLVVFTSVSSKSIALSAAQILLNHIHKGRVDWDTFLVSLKSPHNEVRCRLIPALSYFAIPSAKRSSSANLRERLIVLKIILELINDQSEKVVEAILNTVENIRWNNYEELELLSSGVYSPHEKVRAAIRYLLRSNYNSMTDNDKAKLIQLLFDMTNNESVVVVESIADVLFPIALGGKKYGVLLQLLGCTHTDVAQRSYSTLSNMWNNDEATQFVKRYKTSDKNVKYRIRRLRRYYNKTLLKDRISRVITFVISPIVEVIDLFRFPDPELTRVAGPPFFLIIGSLLGVFVLWKISTVFSPASITFCFYVLLPIGFVVLLVILDEKK
jgi:hypothetical protein